MDVIIDNLYVSRELYSVLFDPICAKYQLTKTEMLVLLFLAKNQCYNTATDIVEKFKLTKSHVSASIRDLSERGYLRGSYEGNNHRTIHLQLCEAAGEIIRAGRQMQEEFLEIICKGFTEEEKKTLQSQIARINDNANGYLNVRFHAKGDEQQYARIQQHH